MSTERHRRLTAAAAKRAIREGRMWYQQKRIGGVINEYLRIIRELAEETRGELLDDLRLTGNAYIGVDHGTAEPTTVAYVAEGGRVRVVPEGRRWTPEMSEEVQRMLRQTQALFRGANERPEDWFPDGLLEQSGTPVASRPRRPPSRQPPPSRREWWR